MPVFAKVSWLFVLVALCSCNRYQNEAREEFSDRHSCPGDRVDVRVRNDLTPSSFASSNEPPAEVKRDPERYQLWVNRTREAKQRMDAGWDCFEVSGCGHLELVCCADADVGGVMCLEKTRRNVADLLRTIGDP